MAPNYLFHVKSTDLLPFFTHILCYKSIQIMLCILSSLIVTILCTAVYPFFPFQNPNSHELQPECYPSQRAIPALYCFSLELQLLCTPPLLK